MEAARRLLTYDDLSALDEDVRAEIINGVFAMSPSALPRHSLAQRALGTAIGAPFHDDHDSGGPGGWWILVEVDVRLGAHDIVRPDLVGWRRERLPNPWDTRPLDVVPDWICEVISPSNASHDQVTKRALYARAGVPYYWLVDPRQRVVTALQLRDGMWLEIGVWDASASVAIEPFEAVELELARLFPPPRPEVSDEAAAPAHDGTDG